MSMDLTTLSSYEILQLIKKKESEILSGCNMGPEDTDDTTPDDIYDFFSLDERTNWKINPADKELYYTDEGNNTFLHCSKSKEIATAIRAKLKDPKMTFCNTSEKQSMTFPTDDKSGYSCDKLFAECIEHNGEMNVCIQQMEQHLFDVGTAKNNLETIKEIIKNINMRNLIQFLGNLGFKKQMHYVPHAEQYVYQVQSFEQWTKKNINSSLIDPVRQYIIGNNSTTMKMTKSEYMTVMKNIARRIQIEKTKFIELYEKLCPTIADEDEYSSSINARQQAKKDIIKYYDSLIDKSNNPLILSHEPFALYASNNSNFSKRKKSIDDLSNDLENNLKNNIETKRNATRTSKMKKENFLKICKFVIYDISLLIDIICDILENGGIIIESKNYVGSLQMFTNSKFEQMVNTMAYFNTLPMLIERTFDDVVTDILTTTYTLSVSKDEYTKETKTSGGNITEYHNIKYEETKSPDSVTLTTTELISMLNNVDKIEYKVDTNGNKTREYTYNDGHKELSRYEPDTLYEYDPNTNVTPKQNSYIYKKYTEKKASSDALESSIMPSVQNGDHIVTYENFESGVKTTDIFVYDDDKTYDNISHMVIKYNTPLESYLSSHSVYSNNKKSYVNTVYNNNDIKHKTEVYFDGDSFTSKDTDEKNKTDDKKLSYDQKLNKYIESQGNNKFIFDLYKVRII